MVKFNETLDLIFSEFSKPEYSVLMNRAKDTFIDFAGSFDEDSLDIEMKWTQFRDWFLFCFTMDRYPLSSDKSSGDKPIQDQNLKFNSPFEILKTPEFYSKLNLSIEVLDAIFNSELTVFQHLKSYKDQIKVRDLISRNKYYVMELDIQLILEKKDYIQTRIFKFEGKYYFGGSYVIHPPLAKKFIDSKIKLLKKEKNKDLKPLQQFNLLENIFRMYYRALRFRLVEIQKIYSDQPLFERRPQVTL